MKKFLRQLITISLSVLFLSLFQVFRPALSAGDIVLKALDTTAGQPALIMLTGKPKEMIDLTVSNPFQSVIKQKFQLSDKGVLQYWYPASQVAGQYAIEYKGLKTTFQVFPGASEAKASLVDLSDYTAFVGETIDGRLTLKDHFGNLIKGRELAFSLKGSGDFSCKNSCVTNQQGSLRFTVSSTKPGLKTLVLVDKTTQTKVMQEELGFIPVMASAAKSSSFQSSFPDFSQDDYIPIFDPLKAKADAKGGNFDSFQTAYQIPSTFRYLSADLVDGAQQVAKQDDTSKSLNALVESATVAVKPVQKNSGFEIVLGTDPTKKFESPVSVTANSALDLVVRAVDDKGNLKKSYTGTLQLQLTPKGPLLPADYTFSPLDQGAPVFELALVLPSGKYTLTATDKDNPDLKGQLEITSQPAGRTALNNTNIVLSLDSPVSNSFYSKNVVVQGTTNTDNTDISIKETGKEIKKISVDTDKKFNALLDLGDGKHSLEITATYLVDGSVATTNVDFEVDHTAPVITKVHSDLAPVRAGKSFQMIVEAEAGAILKAFINNRAYEFTSSATSYTLNADAPLDTGDFPITLQISDKFGNSDTSEKVATLKVTPALSEIKNLFGIPGLGTMTLAWDPIVDAASYAVSFGTDQIQTTQTNKITIEKLSADEAYVFTVTAKDSLGQDASLPTASKSLSPLADPNAKKLVHAAAEEGVQTTPKRHTQSGPEVYIFVLASFLLLNLYGHIRKNFLS